MTDRNKRKKAEATPRAARKSRAPGSVASAKGQISAKPETGLTDQEEIQTGAVKKKVDEVSPTFISRRVWPD